VIALRMKERVTVQRAGTREAKARNRKLMNELKDRPCMDCGGEFPSYVMSFDHRDPDQKKFQLSQVGTRSVAVLLEEAAKCDVVCANCHMIRTYSVLR